MVFLSILIPTRNGDTYVHPLVKSILSEIDHDFELIVSFNQPSIPRWAIKIKDQRFKPIKPTSELSMAKNYEFLLNHALGEWIQIIGDDDGVVPKFIDIIREKIKKYPQTNVHNFKRAYFYWPELVNPPLGTYIFYVDGTKSKNIKFSSEFKKILWGLIHFQDLPQAYTNNVFSRKVLDQWRQTHKENLYREVNPDIYSAVVFSRLKKIKAMQHKTIINFVGTSAKSIGYSKKDGEEKIGKKALEFFEMNRRDGIKISNKISQNLWINGDTRILVASSIDNLPQELKNYFYDKDFIFKSLLILKFKLAIKLKLSRNKKLKKVLESDLNSAISELKEKNQRDKTQTLFSIIVNVIYPVIKLKILLRQFFIMSSVAYREKKQYIIVRNNRVKDSYLLYKILKLREANFSK